MVLTLVLAAVLHGTVVVGPTSPVCREGIPCTKPAAGVVLTFRRGTTVVRATTDRHGVYRVSMKAGTYTVKASVGMQIDPQQVIARSGDHRRNFSIDTGMR